MQSTLSRLTLQKNSPAVLLACIALLIAGLPAHADWQATFVDNFNSAAISSKVWVPGREKLARRIHYFSDDAVEIRDGVLRLKVIDQAEGDRAYGTGVLTTQGVFKQRYGYFEMRAKIPSGQGFWPSFWLMPQNGRWSSEIDIAEFRGHVPNTVHYAAHYGNRLRNEHSKEVELPVPLSDKFHTYAVHWTPERIDFLLNGYVLHSITDTEALANVSDEMFMIVALALSSQHSSWVPTVNAETDLTQAFEVDYIRVYRNVENGEYKRIPRHSSHVPNRLPQAAYDQTALSLANVSEASSPDIIRQPSQILGRLKARSHRTNYHGRITLFLTQMQDYDPQTGRFDKSASLETQHFDVTLDELGDERSIDYRFETPMLSPGTYIIDAVISDAENSNKKNLSLQRTIQFLDESATDGLSVNAFFRGGSASLNAQGVQATVRLQLQEALQLPYVRLQYELYDLDNGELLNKTESVHQQRGIGEQSISTKLTLQNASAKSLGLLARAMPPSGDRTLACIGLNVSGGSNADSNWVDSQGLCPSTPTAPPAAPSNPPPPTTMGGTIPTHTWHPSFVDNFDGDQLQWNNWVPGWDHLFRRINYYDREALRVEDGRLHIDVLQKAQSDRPYSTGIITTRGLFKQRYGYFEMRARIPSGNGFWPSFWLMPESGRWTSEIDIAEFRGHLAAEVHHGFHFGNRLRNEYGGDTKADRDLSSSLNNYAVYWTPQRIDYLFNGRIVHSVTDPSAVASANQEMFLILDLALSSEQASDWIPVSDSRTNLHQSFEVDYVRVYHRNPYGRYRGIPAADEQVPDQRFVASHNNYDHTALSAKRLYAPYESDILPIDWPISGEFELTTHRDNFDGVLSIAVTQVIDFDTASGRYSKSPSLASKSHLLKLQNIGDTITVPYFFDIPLQRPGIYSVDLLIRDRTVNNKATLSSQRIIQHVDYNSVNSSLSLQGFVRDFQLQRRNGQIQAKSAVQLQQALLVPHLRFEYLIVDLSNGDIVDTIVMERPLGHVGLVQATHQLSSALQTGRTYRVTLSVADSSGQLRLPPATRLIPF